MARRWTEAEGEELAILWGVLSTPQIAARLGRTPAAVVVKAMKDKLGDPDRHSYPLKWFYTHHGYYPELVKLAIRQLRLRPVHKKTCRSDRTARRHWAFTEAEKDKICAFLTHRDALQARRAPGGAKVWGQGGEPAACLGCQKTASPPSWRGYCASCSPRSLLPRKLPLRPARVSVTPDSALLALLEEEQKRQPVGKRTRNALMLDLMQEGLLARRAQRR